MVRHTTKYKLIKKLLLCCSFFLMPFNCISQPPVEIKKPSIIMDHYGGLGNQLFQYACAYSLSKKLNIPLYILVHNLSNRSYANYSREYALDKFGVPQDNIINSKDLIGKKVIYITETDILKNNVPNNAILFLNDCCESEIFFKDKKYEILKQFELNIGINSRVFNEILPLIKSSNSVCVHIRRGDFLTSNDYWAIPINYQIKAMNMIKSKIIQPYFFIFSDDIEYAKDNLEHFENTIFVSSLNTSSLEDFYLMSKCKHNIVTNSSFSWWAAYLNKNPEKIVIAPLPRYDNKWYDIKYPNNEENIHKRSLYDKHSYPSSWLTINPFTP